MADIRSVRIKELVLSGVAPDRRAAVVNAFVRALKAELARSGASASPSPRGATIVTKAAEGSELGAAAGRAVAGVAAGKLPKGAGP